MNIDYNIAKWGKLPVKHLVIDTDDFIVFIDEALDLDWITSKAYDSRGHTDSKTHAYILNRVALLECRPNGYFTEKITLDFKRLLGEGLSRALSGEYDLAKQMIDDSEEYLDSRGKELSRTWYLRTAGQTCIIILAITLILWPFHEKINSTWGRDTTLFMTVMFYGAFGALLSIIMRTGKENFDCHAGEAIHKLESRYRIIAGMLSALVFSLAIKAHLILPSFLANSDSHYSLFMFSFICGMSERIAPSITTKIEHTLKLKDHSQSEKTDN